MNVKTTFGYITNFYRKQLGLEKSHVNDAFVIASFTDAKRLDVLFKAKSFKRHYRKLHESQPRLNMFYHHKRKNKTIKRIDRKGKNKNKKYGLLPDGSFLPKPRRFKGSVSLICGFAARDLVKYNKELWFVNGRRSSGYFDIKCLKSGKKLPSSTIHVKNLKLVQRGKSLMITEVCERI